MDNLSVATSTRRPLRGLKILVTRAAAQAGAFSKALRRQGAEVREFPAIELRPPESWARVDREIARLDRYDAVVFTSRNAVERFWSRVPRRARLRWPRTYAVGPGTAAALRERGLRPARLGSEFTTRALGRTLRGRILHPTGHPHSPDLAREARRRGAVVVEPVVYRIVRPRLRRTPPPADLVTFASSQTVRNYAELTHPPRGTACACIGPVTARTAERLGFRVVAQPRRYTIPDLVNAVVRWRTRT
ncbi:MAG: uroporphyrinogen-III synthase [Planctomycetes bacterium]|nr:uroporphyrinogen-III synthase [Planctomycetota bacterium]